MNNVRIKKVQIALGDNVQYLVIMVTWRQRFMHPCITSYIRALSWATWTPITVLHYPYVRSVFILSTHMQPNTAACSHFFPISDKIQPYQLTLTSNEMLQPYTRARARAHTHTHTHTYLGILKGLFPSGVPTAWISYFYSACCMSRRAQALSVDRLKIF